MLGEGGAQPYRRRGMENAFRAEQKNQREALQLQMRQLSLDKEKGRCRYLSGKKRRQIESGIPQLFVTSGHSPHALPPEGPRDNAYRNSPYFSSTATSKVDEKRLLKWRAKERQFEKKLQEETENLSPWAKAEKEEDSRRVWNQIAWIMENSHKGNDLVVGGEKSPDAEDPGNATSDGKQETAGQTNGRVASSMSAGPRLCGSSHGNGSVDHLQMNGSVATGDLKRGQMRKPVDVFADLINETEEVNDDEMTMSRFVELSKPKTFNHKSWESKLIERYASAVTKPVASATVSRQINQGDFQTWGESDESDKNMVFEDVVDASVKRTAWPNDDAGAIQNDKESSNSESLSQVEAANVPNHEPEQPEITPPSGSRNSVRPLSANGTIRHRKPGYRKRIKSAGTLNTHDLTEKPEDATEKPSEKGRRKSGTIQIPTGSVRDSRRLSNITEKSGFSYTRKTSYDAGKSVPSEDDAFSVAAEKNCSYLDNVHPKNSESSLKTPKRSAKGGLSKKKLRESSAKLGSSRDSKDSSSQKAKRKKKKVVTKIKELEDEVTDSDSDDLEQEALGVSERISQWRRDLMREAPPGVYSVNAPIKIKLTVSKSQLQKDYNELVKEQARDVQQFSEQERARRLRSRMSVYMTMKVVEKAVGSYGSNYQ